MFVNFLYSLYNIGYHVTMNFQTLVDTLSIPVNYNGSIYTDEDAIKAQAETGAGGVMVARGLLANPGLFDGRLEGIRGIK